MTQIDMHMQYSQRKLVSSTLYLVKTNQNSSETQLATYLGGTNWHLRGLPEPPSPSLFQWATLYSMQRRKKRTKKKQSTNHNVPLHVKRTTAVCTCSHNGQSALTFCVSPVQDSGPWKGEAESLYECGGLLDNDSSVWLPLF